MFADLRDEKRFRFFPRPADKTASSGSYLNLLCPNVILFVKAEPAYARVELFLHGTHPG